MASHTMSQTTSGDTYMDRHPKRRRLSLLQDSPVPTIDEDPLHVNGLPELPTNRHADDMDAEEASGTKDWRTEAKDTSIAISTTSKLAEQTVAPFLAKHIPDQYAPLGASGQVMSPTNKNPNTKYCYRHRPDLKCRRQADEPSMDQLQHVGVPLYPPTDIVSDTRTNLFL